MNASVHDLRPTIIPKSDQLNSEQLLGGPIIITVTDVSVGTSKEQPVIVHYEGDQGRPYKPCLTMRKVLIHAWGPDGTKWRGRSMELYCDPSVKFGGEMVGGIRIARLSDIPKEIKVSLTATKGRKALHEIGLLQQSRELVAALGAIGSAYTKEALRAARPLAEKVTAPSEVAVVQAAYNKRAADIKAGLVAPAASPSGAPTAPGFNDDDQDDEVTFTEDQVAANIRAASTTDILDLARDQIAGVQDEEARSRLRELADAREAELREPA